MIELRVKSIWSWLIIGMVSCTADSVPDSVKNKFLEIEPSAYSIRWVNDGDIYKVYYKLKDKDKVTSYFDFNGNWMETETEIEVEELSAAVIQVLQIKFSEYEIVDIEIVNTSDGQVLYEVDLSKESKTYDILFDTTGRILRKRI